MPNICHGKGDLTRDGCCFVGGQVCPLRWRIGTDGNVYDAQNNNLGAVETFIRGYTKSKPRQDAIRAALKGRVFICSVAVRVYADDPSRANDPAAFATAWDNDPEYVAQVRPHWAVVEENLGLEQGGYNCSTWQGTGAPQCCFAETPEENAAKAADLANPDVGIGESG